MKIITNVYIFKTPDNIKTYKALWDTGATETLISNKVVKELDLNETENVEILTVNGLIKTKRYRVGLMLDNHSKFINIQPAEFLHRKEFDVIIGMDIIEHGLFILDHSIFSFTMDMIK